MIYCTQNTFKSTKRLSYFFVNTHKFSGCRYTHTDTRKRTMLNISLVVFLLMYGADVSKTADRDSTQSDNAVV